MVQIDPPLGNHRFSMNLIESHRERERDRERERETERDREIAYRE